MPSKPSDWKPGDGPTAGRLNEWAEYSTGVPFTAGGGIAAGGGSIKRQGRGWILAKLSGSVSPYSFTSQVDNGTGSLVNGPTTGTSAAYEVNGVSGLNNKVVRLYPDGHGKYNFQYLNCCGGGGCTGTYTATIQARCNSSTNVTSASVTISLSGSPVATGTTNGSGNFSTTALTSSATYDLTVTKAGYATYTGTFVFSCANVTVTANMITASNTITGNVLCGLTSIAVPGATVTAKESPSGTTIGSATTNSSGAFSIAASGYTTHSYTLTFSQTNYTTATGGIGTLSCTGTTVASTARLFPVSGKSCQCSGLVADATTLTFSSSGYSTTLTYDNTASAYIGTLSVSCRAITGLGCSKSTASVTLYVRYEPSACALGVTFNRQGLSSASCTGSGGIEVPASDAWCATLSGLNQCTNLYGNGGGTLSSTTGYPYVATYTGVLFYDADSAAFLTGATVSE